MTEPVKEEKSKQRTRRGQRKLPLSHPLFYQITEKFLSNLIISWILFSINLTIQQLTGLIVFNYLNQNNSFVIRKLGMINIF